MRESTVDKGEPYSPGKLAPVSKTDIRYDPPALVDFGRTIGSHCRLLLFPYAGGSANAFVSHLAGVGADIGLCGIELPGRGFRFKDAVDWSIVDIAAQIAEQVDSTVEPPFALFGHSMGALIAYEVARCLERGPGPQPVALFASSCRAPDQADRDEDLRYLTQSVFLEKVAALGGMPLDASFDTELGKLFGPIIRADFERVWAYGRRPRRPLCCPLIALGGRHDDLVPIDDLDAWSAITSGPFRRTLFDGNHFYLDDNQDAVRSLVADVLSPVMQSSSTPLRESAPDDGN